MDKRKTTDLAPENLPRVLPPATAKRTDLRLPAAPEPKPAAAPDNPPVVAQSPDRATEPVRRSPEPREDSTNPPPPAGLANVERLPQSIPRCPQRISRQ